MTKPKSKAPKSKLIATATPKSAIVPLDPLQRYFSQIGKYDILTPEKEHELAVQFHQTKDPKAAYELTVRNLRLVVKIAMEYRRAWSNALDLIQEGNIGLLAAIQKFDPYRNIRLTTYAAWWIRAYILKFIMNNWRLIKIGNTQAERKLFYNLRKEQERLLAEGFVPDTKTIATRLNVAEKDVIDMSRRLGPSEMSIDMPPTASGKDGETLPPLSDTIDVSAESLDDTLAKNEITALVQRAITDFRKTLKPREVSLLDRRILAEEPATLQEIGEEMGVSRERVRQIEERLMQKFKTFLLLHNPGIEKEMG